MRIDTPPGGGRMVTSLVADRFFTDSVAFEAFHQPLYGVTAKALEIRAKSLANVGAHERLIPGASRFCLITCRRSAGA